MLFYRLRGAIGSMAVLALVGCSTMTVRSDYDELASFTHLRTYAWMHRADDAGGSYANPAFNSPLTGRRIRDAVDQALAHRGFIRVASGDADFRIAYHVVAEERVTVRQVNDLSYRHYGYRSFSPFFYGYPGAGFGTQTYVREYLQGTLILDVVDGKKDELVWRGWASKALDRDPKPDQVQAYVAQAVERILEGFPPGGAPRRQPDAIVAPDAPL